MVTIYDLLEVDENASKNEIEKSYQKLILEYHKDPSLTPEENADNELILNKLKIAYEILMDDEKRAKYNKDLAKKRAEELIKNVTVSNETSNEELEKKEEVQNNNTNSDELSSETNSSDNQYNDEEFDDGASDEENNYQPEDYLEEEVTLSKEEQKKVQKAAQNEFKANLRKAQKAEEEYNKAYNEAYNNYMRKMGYKVKEPMTLKRVMNAVIFVIAVLIVCAIAWIIPPIRNLLIDLYNENIIIKALVDIVRIFFTSIMSIFKQ